MNREGSPAVSNLIRQGKLDQLETAMQSGAQTGMQTMDTALMTLVRKGRVSALDAYHQANNKAKFRSLVDDESEIKEPDLYGPDKSATPATVRRGIMRRDSPIQQITGGVLLRWVSAVQVYGTP